MEKIKDFEVENKKTISRDDYYNLAVKLVELPENVRNGVKELTSLLNRRPNDSYNIPERLLNGFEGFFENLYEPRMYNTGAVRGNSTGAARKLSEYFGEEIERTGSGERIKELVARDFVKNLGVFKEKFNTLNGDKKDNFVALIRNEVLKDGVVDLRGDYEKYCDYTGDNYVFFSKGTLDKMISDFDKKYLAEDMALSLMNINKDRG